MSLLTGKENHYLIFGIAGKEEAPDVKGSTPVEETKQKEKGKIQVNPVRVFDEYQEYIKNKTDCIEPGFPVGINIGATGSYLVDLWMIEERKKFDTFQEVVDYLNMCLKKVKRQEEDKPADNTAFQLKG